jgi:integrase
MLKNTQIINSKPCNKPYKLTDGEGLYIQVTPQGSKLWRLRYRLAGKENVFAIGPYPDIGIKDAREEKIAAKKLIAEGIHPAHQRKLKKIRQIHEHANSFEAVAQEWLKKQEDIWTPRTLRQRKSILKRDVYSEIGSLPIKQVTPAHVLIILKKVENRAPSIAVVVNQMIGAISRYAVATLRAEIDPTNPLRGSLKQIQTQHKKPLTPDDIPDFMAALEEYSGFFSNKIALKLLWLTLARSVEVLHARWDEFDRSSATWVVPAKRMKKREQHKIPLPRQAVELLEHLRPLTGKSEYLFPNRSNLTRPASIGVFWKMFSSMGYQGRFSPHGIRVTGSTILNEQGFRPDIIETQLAHQERNKTRASYNQAEYLEERRTMMQQWADYLDGLKSGSSIVPIKKKA